MCEVPGEGTSQENQENQGGVSVTRWYTIIDLPSIRVKRVVIVSCLVGSDGNGTSGIVEAFGGVGDEQPGGHSGEGYATRWTTGPREWIEQEHAVLVAELVPPLLKWAGYAIDLNRGW